MVQVIENKYLPSLDEKKARRIENLRKANRPSNGKQTKKVSLGYRDFSFL
jgi:hypothetical protein